MEKSRKKIALIAILILVMSIAFWAVGCNNEPSNETTSVQATLKNIDPFDSAASIVVTVIDGQMSYIPDSNIVGYVYVGMFSQTGEKYFDSNGTPLLQINKEITLFCKWQATPYQIEFYNGETLIEAATFNYDSEDTYVPIAPDKDGYTFVGWGLTPTSEPIVSVSQTGKAFNKQNFPLFNFKTTKIVKLRSIYKIKTYEVKFVFSQDDHVKNSVDHGSRLPQAPTREFVGKKVIGWSLDENGTIQFNDIITSDITLYPIFAFSYTLSFDTNNGGQLSPISEIEGKTVTLPIPTREHYIFLGWYGNSSLSGSKVESVTVSENRKFFADWDTKKYTITYHTGSAQIADAKLYTVEDIKVPLATLVDESRKLFKGWSPIENDKSITLKELNTSSYCRNIDLYAVWTGEPITLTMINEGTANTTQVVEYGNAFILPTPTKKGYAFKGWQTAENKLVTNDKGESITSWIHTENSVTLTAKFDINKYKIVIDSNPMYGKVTGAGEYDFGTAVSIIIEPNAGYILKGAYCGDTLLSDKTTFNITIDNKNININLVWFVEKESVIVTSKYGELDASTKCVVSGEGEYKTGAQVTLSVLPKKEYMLDGWYVNGSKVSSEYSYTFTKSDIKTLVVVKIVDNNGVTKFISTKSDLALLNDNAGKTFILLNDIDFQYDLWATIANFEGSFYGSGHTIKNLTISNIADNVGMFGFNKGLIRDLTVENATVSFLKQGGNVNVGILCGNNGGAAGVIDNCVIKNCKMTAGLQGVNATFNMGAVAGYNTAAIKSICVVNLVVDTKNNTRNGDDGNTQFHIGGLVGFHDETGTIDNCSVTGDFKYFLETNGYRWRYSFNGIRVAGLVGLNEAIVQASAFEGSIVVTKAVDDYGDPTVSIGGAIGQNNADGKVRDCHANTSKIYVDKGYAYCGGFVGENWGSVERCYAKTDTSVAENGLFVDTNWNNTSVGGFVGWQGNTGKILKCLSNTVTIKESTAKNKGAFCGRIDSGSTFTMNRFAGVGVNQDGVADAVLTVTSQYFFNTLYWDTNVWQAVDGGYPILKNTLYKK